MLIGRTFSRWELAVHFGSEAGVWRGVVVKERVGEEVLSVESLWIRAPWGRGLPLKKLKAREQKSVFENLKVTAKV